jgi:hypothetical protein
MMNERIQAYLDEVGEVWVATQAECAVAVAMVNQAMEDASVLLFLLEQGIDIVEAQRIVIQEPC